MSICIVRIREVEVNLCGTPTVRIRLPSDYQTNFVSDAKGRQAIQNEKNPSWIKVQIEEILQKGKGYLATQSNPMRSFGAGVLARVSTESPYEGPFLVLNIRGSNRGSVWPLGIKIADMLCWKEFAGVTGSPDELLNPRVTAIKELYEEISFVSDKSVLFPSDIASYSDTKEQVEVAIDRANKHYGFSLSALPGFYPAIRPDDLNADTCTTVEISDGRQKSTFPAIVNYDPATNALEISFIADITLRRPLTGILSLAGPENNDITVPPYMEDVVVVRENKLRKAMLGQPVPVKHLLSVHGPNNLLKSSERSLHFAPAATFVPLVWYLDGTYSFRKVLAAARGKLP